jgi:Binding-protein-dependent transport system inner membrane component
MRRAAPCDLRSRDALLPGSGYLAAGALFEPYTAAVLALSTQSGAFYAEVFRGGIVSVERGQWEGAKALGMRYHVALRRIILPQALRRMVAPFVERSFELTKTTALASSLAYGELLYQATQVNSITFRPMEVYTTIAPGSHREGLRIGTPAPFERWRRDRDSNPGYLAVYVISSHAPSTTRPSLRSREL